MILVTGATGTVGRALTRALRQRNAAVRALVRDPRRASDLVALGVELFEGDLARPETYRDAFRDVDRAFLLTPVVPHQAEMEIAFIDAAIRADVARLVKHSAVGADQGAGAGMMSDHGKVERYLQETAIAHVSVRPTQFMQDLLQWVPAIAQAHALVMPLVDEGVRVNLVDVADVVDVEATVLLSEAPVNRVLTPTGPDLLRYAEVAERLSRGAGTPIPLRVLAPDAYRREGIAAGYPAKILDAMVNYFSTLRTGQTALAVITDDVLGVTGHAPRSLEQFARDHAGELRQGAGGRVWLHA
jgi:uncharacterized protein YbjT (DUF2867 family)